MANPEHLAILSKGVDIWNEWRRQHPDIHVDLSRGDLAGAELAKADLRRADLSGSDLRRTNLMFADLVMANLAGADLSGSDLSRAELNGADLSRAFLGETRFTSTNLRGADLSEADLCLATLSETDLGKTNLSGADLSFASRLRQLEGEKNRLYDLLALAIDKAGTKLLVAGRDIVNAEDNATINIDQHVENYISILIIVESVMRTLAGKFTEALHKAIEQGGTEPQVVARFAHSIKSLSGPTSGGMVSIRSESIHQRPYVFFVSPATIQGATKTELGDLLLVVKKKQGGQTLRTRAAFLQAKWTDGRSIRLTPHQHDFQRDLYLVSFRFGNRLYKNLGWHPIVWSHITRSKWLLSNLFLDRDLTSLHHRNTPACICCAKDIDRSLTDYTLSCVCAAQRMGLSFMDYIDFLLSFKKVGHRITPTLRQMLRIIYERIGWEADPVEEWHEYFDRDVEGAKDHHSFTVVEISINNEQLR